jgi:bacillithiol system protein YtxJ
MGGVAAVWPIKVAVDVANKRHETNRRSNIGFISLNVRHDRLASMVDSRRREVPAFKLFQWRYFGQAAHPHAISEQNKRMGKWWSEIFGGQEESSVAAEPESAISLEGILASERAIVFKHSRTCAVSWAARREVERFQKGNPELPVYTVTVQKQRELSRAIEQQTGIRHESPQVIFFKSGHAIHSASHEDVTEENLTAMADASSSR